MVREIASRRFEVASFQSDPNTRQQAVRSFLSAGMMPEAAIHSVNLWPEITDALDHNLQKL